MEPSVRASIFVSSKAWLLENYPELWHEFVQTFPESEHRVWTADQLDPTEWLPASVYANMHKAFMTLLTEWKFEQLAGYVAFDHIGSFMKFFMRLGTPSVTLRMLPNAYRQYFSAGVFKVHYLNSQSAKTELAEAGAYGRAGCAGSVGWIRKALTHVGAKDLSITQPECCFRGGKRCILEFSWK